MKFSILLFSKLFFFAIGISCQNFNLSLGSSKITFESIQFKTDSILFVNLHHDEITSIKAIKAVLPKYYGKYVGLKNAGKREVSLFEKGKPLKFDPNRIYTQVGIEKTLRNYGSYSELNAKLLQSFSLDLLNRFSKAELLIALHNNSNGGFSVNSILKEKQTKNDALQVFVNPVKDEDDFYYVTQKSEFDYFKSMGYNVVLQDNEKVEDDGSLSVWCGKNDIDYINVECQSGHLEEQMQMIREVFNVLRME